METKKYTKNPDIIVTWTPEKCIHAGVCVRKLPQVYKPKEKPWVSPQKASAEDLILQIKQCPSGALEYEIPQWKIQHKDSETKGVFELMDEYKKVGEMTYSKAGEDRIIVDHTQIDSEYSGQGLGRKLVDAAAQFARDKHIKIVPLCPFASRIMKENREKYGDVL